MAQLHTIILTVRRAKVYRWRNPIMNSWFSSMNTSRIQFAEIPKMISVFLRISGERNCYRWRNSIMKEFWIWDFGFFFWTQESIVIFLPQIYTGLLPSPQVPRCTVQYIYCMFFFTVTVSHHHISNDSISCNLLHFLISEGEYGWRNRMDLRHPPIGSQVTVG